MLGMDYWYVDQHVQSPSDEDNVRAIASLIAAGYIDRRSSPRTSFSR